MLQRRKMFIKNLISLRFFLTSERNPDSCPCILLWTTMSTTYVQTFFRSLIEKKMTSYRVEIEEKNISYVQEVSSYFGFILLGNVLIDFFVLTDPNPTFPLFTGLLNLVITFFSWSPSRGVFNIDFSVRFRLASVA